MTTPDKPLLVQFEVEIAGTPEQVWEAIASADGISSWFLPTDFEPGEGGRIVAHMGEDDSPGTITGWDPPRRLVYEEPDWASLAGHAEADVTPLTNEFLVEARSGGTCVVRVTASAFGTGADWEDEFFEEMGEFYRPFFELLRIYVECFPGQTAARRELRIPVADGVGAEDIVPAAARSLGVGAPGETVGADGPLGLAGTVLRVALPYLMVETDAPLPGYVCVQGMCGPDEVTTTLLTAWLFGDDAEPFADKAEDGWRAWLAGLGR